MKKILILLLLVMAVIPIGSASAAPTAGILRGLLPDQGAAYAALTDGSESTNYRFTAFGQSVTWTLPNVVRVTGIYLNTGAYVQMRLYDESNNLLFTNGSAGSASAYYTLPTPVQGVKKVFVGHTYSGCGANCGEPVYEFDLQAQDTVPPPVPTGLAASNVTASGLTLTWSAVTAPADFRGYYIYRNGTKQNTTPQTGTTYNATGLNANTTYSWTVRSVDQTGNESAHSTAVTTHYDSLAPPVPGNLHTISVTNGGVQLQWNGVTDAAGGSGLRGYNVYRNGNKITSSPIVGTSYSATGVSNNTAYSWTVTSIDNAGNESAPSVEVVTLYDTIPPAQPMGLAAIVGQDSADLSWYPNNETDLAGYHVYLDNARLTSSLLTVTTYTIADLTPGDIYDIGVTATDTSNNESTPAAMSIAPEIPDTTPPNVPGGLSATPGSREALLTWTANSEPDLAGYNLYRNGVKINSSLLTGTSYTDDNLVNGTAYGYELTAVDQKGNESARSPAVMVTPDSAANPPKQLKAKQVSGGVQLTWEAPQPAPDVYKIYRAGVEIAEIGGSSLTYTDPVTSAGTSYQYHVSAVLEGEESAKAAASVYFSTIVIDYPESGAGFTARDLLDGTMGYISLFAGFILLILSIAFAPRIKDFLFSLFGASGGNQDGTYTVRVKNPAKVRKLLNDNAKFNYAPVLGKGKRRRRGGGI